MRVLVVCIVALCLATHGIGANLWLSQEGSFLERYKSFIRSVRQEIGSETYQPYGIPVLKNFVSNSDRFYFINFYSIDHETLNLAVDVKDMAVVAYHVEGNNQSYFFPNAPPVAFHIDLFPNAHRALLNFNNTFQSLENAAGTSRQKIPLGIGPSRSAISNIVHYRSEFLPESFLVIFQMFFEAAKFKFIEQSVVNSLRDGLNFTPDLAIVSLEDNWPQLSSQVQASPSLQGLFGSVVGLYNSNNQLIEVDSVYYPIILPNLALQLYNCKVSLRDGIVPMQNYIKMPGVGGHDADNNDGCYIQSRTTRISGREGFCADVAGSLTADGSRLILYPCGQQANQKWTFQSDGTIRSLGKCLTTNNMSFGNSVVIYDCTKAAPKDITWDVSIDGTIKNPNYDLVLTSKTGTGSTNLTMETNIYAASQGWRVGNYVNPIIASIIGVQEMCLEATDANTNMWLEKCVKNKREQSWALYSDGTIRVNNNHSLCVTSSANASSKLVTILNCNGSANQRWLFMADGTILNPKNETLLMDVAQNNVNLKKIIMHPRNGEPNQQWVFFY